MNHENFDFRGFVWLAAINKAFDGSHDVTLICRSKSSALINSEGTEVRIKLRDEDVHRSFRSKNFVGKLNAVTPADARPKIMI